MYLDLGGACAADALIVVIDRNAQRYLRFLLPDDVFIELSLYLMRLRERGDIQTRHGARGLLLHNGVAQLNALIANIHAVARYYLLHLILGLVAERAGNP